MKKIKYKYMKNVFQIFSMGRGMIACQYVKNIFWTSICRGNLTSMTIHNRNLN
jgi:hypothetical protein